MTAPLGRRMAAELVGSAFLVMAVVGSGIAATRLSPGDPGLQLLVNSIVTGAALIALILALQSVSASFNPAVTLAQLIAGGVGALDAAWLVVSQVAGAVLGCVVANLMFGLDAVSISAKTRSGGGQWLAEAIATAGLLLVVLACLRSGRPDRIAYAVGGYITAAYWFTSSTSFANPAVTVARMFSDTFAGIAPRSAGPFVALELVGGLVAVLFVRWLIPAGERAEAPSEPVPAQAGRS